MKIKQNNNLLQVGNKFLNKQCKKKYLLCTYLQSYNLWVVTLGQYDRCCYQIKNTESHEQMLQLDNSPKTNYTKPQ